MRGKYSYLPIFLLLLASALFADTVSRTFVIDYLGVQNGRIITDIESSPTFSAPNIVCVNTPFTPSLGVSSDWFSSQYDAQLGNAATSGTCLIADSSANNNQGVNWLTPAQFSSLSSQNLFSTVSNFNNFVASMPHQQSIEGSKYLKPDFSNYPGLQRADIGMYCKADAYLLMNGNPFRTLAQPYLGSALSTGPITLSTPGTYNFQVRMDVTGCTMSGRTFLTGCSESVWMYHNGNAGFQGNSPTVVVTAENPFSCNLAANGGTYSPPNPPAGSQISFSFNLVNNGIRDLSVSAIALEAGSQFSNMQITGPAIPFTVTANGGTRLVSGTATVPNAQGTYPLRLSVTSRTTAGDCTGTQKDCNVPALFIVDVVVGPGGSNTCVISLDKSTFTVTPTTSDSTTARAVCRDPSNNVIACPVLTWSHNLVPGPSTATFNPNPTASIPNPTTIFTVNAGTPAQSGKTVSATGTGVTCNTLSNVQVQLGGGQSCSLSIPSKTPPYTFNINEQADVLATCQNPAACPSLDWSATNGIGSLNPTHTNPPTVISRFTATTAGSGTINAVNGPLICTIPGGVTVLPAGTLSCHLTLDKTAFNPTATLDDSTLAHATCRDASNNVVACPALTWLSDVSPPPAIPYTFQPNPTPTGLNTQTTFTVKAGTQSQSGRTVSATGTNVICDQVVGISVGSGGGSGFSITSCGFVPPHPQPFVPPESATVQATCTDGTGAANCPALTWSIVNMQQVDLVNQQTPQGTSPQSNTFNVHAGAPQQSGGQIVIECLNPLECNPSLARCTVSNINIGSSGKPDYTARVVPRRLVYNLGDTAIVDITTSNTGSVPGGATSQTTVTDSNECQPQTPPFSVPGLGSGRGQTDTYVCACTKQGLHVITATADAIPAPNGVIEETSETNNKGTNIFYCCPVGGCLLYACFDYF